MDCEDLIKSLWLQAEEKIGTIQREAKEEAERIRHDSALKVEGLREEYKKDAVSESEKRAGDILSDAEKKMRQSMIWNNRKLSGRLYRLACLSLVLLRKEERSNVFDVLAKELPALPWTMVRVNPADKAQARINFPSAEIISDDAISGGMDVTTGDNSVRVTNTFEKRLERVWEDIIPLLLKGYYEKV